jgi:hypothetical protein
LAGAKGTERSRTPIASKTAFEMAEPLTSPIDDENQETNGQ